MEENARTAPPAKSSYILSPKVASPSAKVNPRTPKTSAPVTPRTPLMASIEGDDDEYDDDKVKAYNERKCLAVSRNDAKTAIEELNKFASGVILVVIIIVWFILMEITTNKVLVFISSQILVVVFMFGNTAKMVFEAMIFVFVMHPFDVGDRCVIDGMQMVVDEMNILTTIFLKPENEKIDYPNSVLATKPIINFNRSPKMGDAVDFAIDFSTSEEKIADTKAKIKAYLDNKPQQWRPNHSVQLRETVDVHKMNMALYVNHTMNFQNSGERGNRKSDLVFELKRIFEELGIVVGSHQSVVGYRTDVGHTKEIWVLSN